MVIIHRVFQRITIRHQNLLRIIPNRCASSLTQNDSLINQARTLIGHNNAVGGGGGCGSTNNNSSSSGRTTRLLASTARTLSTASPAAASTDESKTDINSVAVETLPRALPTRHSRHHIPKVAPFDSLEGMGDKLLDAVPGTLFVYEADDLKLTKPEEYENGLTKSYRTQQTVEYILRGYNVTFPKSLVQTTSPDSITDDDWKRATGANPYEERLDRMMKLLERTELEGDVYVELRTKFRSQLARRNADEGEIAAANGDDLTMGSAEETEATRMQQLFSTYGAPPGPSTVMYDLILDAISVSIPYLSPPVAIAWIRKAALLMERALERHSMDVIAGEMDKVNLDSIPSPITFNAVIRSAANAPYDGKGEEMRDVALETAFFTYDAMHHHLIVDRNTATYRYILQTVGKYIPVSPSKGNIAHALFVKACVEERVLDETLVDALLNNVMTGKDGTGKADSLGIDFDSWIDNNIKTTFHESKNGYGFPIKWSSKKRMKRYDRRFAAY